VVSAVTILLAEGMLR
jgi:hypothetical protein